MSARTSTWRVWLPWALLGVVLIAVLAVAATRTASTEPADRADTLARELRCPTCVNESVFESQSATADAIRSDIARRIEARETDAQIKAAYVDRYTEWILLTPSNDGIGFVVWGLPVIVLVLGGAGVAYAVGRGRRKRAATQADEAVVAELREGP